MIGNIIIYLNNSFVWNSFLKKEAKDYNYKNDNSSLKAKDKR